MLLYFHDSDAQSFSPSNTLGPLVFGPRIHLSKLGACFFCSSMFFEIKVCAFSVSLLPDFRSKSTVDYCLAITTNLDMYIDAWNACPNCKHMFVCDASLNNFLRLVCHLSDKQSVTLSFFFVEEMNNLHWSSCHYTKVSGNSKISSWFSKRIRKIFNQALMHLCVIVLHISW